MKNSDSDGNLLHFETKAQYKSSGLKLWLYLKLKIFRYDGTIHGVFCCDSCDVMKGVEKLKLSTSPSEIRPLQCFHSMAAEFLVPDWRDIWPINIPVFCTMFSPKFNHEVDFFFYKKKEEKSFLRGVLVDGHPHLIITVTKRQSTPFCSSCQSTSCTHFKAYAARLKNQEIRASAFGEEVSPPEASSSQQVPESVDPEEEETNRHYQEMPPIASYHKMYGYNHSKILYPFERSRTQQQIWAKRVQGIYDFPQCFIPVWSEDFKCQHGYMFDANDENLVVESSNIIVFGTVGEQVFDVTNYGRKSVGACNCLLRYDGHPQLLWNLGSGRFINYTVLNLYLHLWKNNGLSMMAMQKSIVEMSISAGLKSSLTYDDVHRAISGFFMCLSFDEDVAFKCPTHGNSPEWINTDGKCTGPLRRRVQNVEELGPDPDDLQTLEPSTRFRDRVFLALPKERALASEFVTEKVNHEEFIEKAREGITSENGTLIVNLVNYVSAIWNDDFPKPYRNFISNICKGSSVRGLLQVEDQVPLNYLELWCNDQINIRDSSHIKEMQILMKELPALWPILDNICDQERTCFLPRVVSEIVLKLLEIRQKTFENAIERNPEDYVPWRGGEHPTMCYPSLKLFRYPKRVKISAKKDTDACDKKFQSHSDFTAGIFTVGCACPYNTTLGFELMIEKESPHNLFRLLECRDIDFFTLKGFLLDHACLMDSYIMNREAKMIEFKKVLVDGVHWNSHSKTKKASKGKGGHVGCSDSFNWNLYKKHYDEKINSQGREQVNSLVEKCSSSLRLMSYQHFMRFMYVFFACTNLQNRRTLK